jgi:hypothetical protein
LKEEELEKAIENRELVNAFLDDLMVESVKRLENDDSNYKYFKPALKEKIS